MYLPDVTYRVQFNRDFTFAHLREILPYLHQLGIKTIYASPVFEAVPGSVHGYDGIDPNKINPEIGTLEEFREIAAMLKESGMGWLQDFVPNHMAFTPLNPWLCDFLEKGKMSFYDTYFDKNPDEPLMAPFLGRPFEEELEAGNLQLIYTKGRLQVRYYDNCYPLNYTAWADILGHEALDALSLDQVREKLDHLSQVTDVELFQDAWEELQNSLEWVLSDPAIAISFREGLQQISAHKALLRRLCEQQFYRLCHWKETDKRINYRRFFTINGLIGMHMHHPHVFEHYHRLLLQLVAEGCIQGIRIDHIDGLYDPDAYLDQLRQKVKDIYIVTEKILEQDEVLPADWPVQGTTGYDFLAQVSQVVTNRSAAAVFADAYRKLDPKTDTVQEQVYACKRKILYGYMQGELDNLVRLWNAIPGTALSATPEDSALKTLIAELLIVCPVYRFYPRSLPLSLKEQHQLNQLMDVVQSRGHTDTETLSRFRKSIHPDEQAGRAYQERLLHFWRRFMQLSGPLMAKGVEDTLMYRYLRFPAHNEVGDDPARFGMSFAAFHDKMQQRLISTPHALNATATHDTKQGEDARARLLWCSRDPEGWWIAMREWLQLAQDSAGTLSLKDQYGVAVAVYGHLPLLEQEYTGFDERLEQYLRKAAREAKLHSSWEEPDEAYEEALAIYGKALSDRQSLAGKSIRQYLQQHKAAMLKYTLIQLVLKCTCPGIPDIYQGTEYTDFSFVDPDNRRSVDYTDRWQTLQKIIAAATEPLRIDSDPDLIKCSALYRLLQLRSSMAALFREGTYEPVMAGDHCLSFLRRYKNEWLWVWLPLDEQTPVVTPVSALPAEAPRKWTSLFTGHTIVWEGQQLEAELAAFPVAVFSAYEPSAARSAGILLPLFSLPSGEGIGTLGKAAHDWLRFLARSGQRYWQLLPMNPIAEENAYSPYAAVSAFAGEPLYIDLELLADEGLLSRSAVQAMVRPQGETIMYREVWTKKCALLQQAWHRFYSEDRPALQREFAAFLLEQASWLEDYALFVVLKRKYGNAPWYTWPEPVRDRHPEALESVRLEAEKAIAYEQWLQFLFYRQWAGLRCVAARYNISLVGDLPFYMSHDAADVWVHRRFFKLDASGRKTAVAGVPPDYFSVTGQLWGMPTYDWQALEKENYSWWLQRLKANAGLYDLVRLDHFRAFYDYWELPGDAETAIDGEWRQGPQQALFDLLQQHFPAMPFIAEDLGEIHQGVFRFKDHYHLPGMRVLQFGFSAYDARLRDLPHNFDRLSVVYTGTHDNDMIAGWYTGLDATARDALSAYAGYVITEDNVADALCRMAYASVARIAILPLQDIMGLDSRARINTPATTKGNWTWRMSAWPDDSIANRLLGLVKRYNR